MLALFLIVFVVLPVGGVAFIIFLCALPFLRKLQNTANRFGSQSPTVTIVQAGTSGFTRAFDFAGRSNRLDFFTFAIVVGVLCGLSLCAVVILAYMARENPTWWSAAPLLLIPLLAVPSLSVAVRRLHDVNRSGWWLLLLLVFGYFILLYWFLQASQTDEVATGEVFA
ncbi:DUF805 domain-containing protein [Asticcacaulis endophyticus]|uniref:DUF805 domain-containing protein n=1 Tax=Asticcacaulis endophyticus TaxID=1395890 RepID=A0A918QE98_9CAUL|nr:DUF805 domain-containing protein [Asticcacaulis endophyticus]GGZ43027.1 hypothetical protein GCM10011273_32210 [Asticcacaulis endophyticus]